VPLQRLPGGIERGLTQQNRPVDKNMPSCTSRKRNKISWLLATHIHPEWYFLIYNTYIQIFQFNKETNKKNKFTLRIIF